MERILVCLHGFLESSTMWSGFLEDSGSLKVCIDLPGHGGSTLPSATTMVEMAGLVHNLLQEKGISTYDVIGHSMGGYVALELKKRDPNCRRVILLNSNTWADDEQKQKDRERVAALVKHNKRGFIYEAIPYLFWRPEDHDAAVRELINEANQMSSEAIASAALGMRDRIDNTEFTKSLGKDVLIIQGKQDLIIPVVKMHESALPEIVVYKELEHSAHMAHLEQPVESRRAILEFLE